MHFYFLANILFGSDIFFYWIICKQIFGSLFALGYPPIQILLVGAYIVSSYFAIVEKQFGRLEQVKMEYCFEAVIVFIVKRQFGRLKQFIQPQVTFGYVWLVRLG